MDGGKRTIAQRNQRDERKASILEELRNLAKSDLGEYAALSNLTSAIQEEYRRRDQLLSQIESLNTEIEQGGGEGTQLDGSKRDTLKAPLRELKRFMQHLCR